MALYPLTSGGLYPSSGGRYPLTTGGLYPLTGGGLYPLGGGAVTAYRAAVMALNPLGYWRLGDLSGTVCTDETGTNTGSYVGAPTLGVTGLTTDSNKAATFDGTTQYALLRTGTPIIGGLVNHSIIAWCNNASLANVRAFYSERPASGNDLCRMEINSGNGAICATYRDDAGTLNQPKGSLVITGGPHFICQVKSGTTITWYVDGVADATTGTLTATDAFTNANIQARINGDASGTFLPSTTDEVAVFGVALTAPQIAALYAFHT